MAVICQLYEAGWQLSVSYMRQDISCLESACNLSATWGRIAVICQLHEMRKDSGCLQGVYYSVCNLKRDSGCLSATWGRMAIVCRVCVCVLSNSRSGMAVVCQLHETGWWMFAGNVCTPLVTCDRLSVVCKGVCTLSVTWARSTVVCRVCVYPLSLETTWRLYVSYMRQVGGFLYGCAICQLF
jgi:hypothetical protein